MTTMTKSGFAVGLTLGALVLGWGALRLGDALGAGRAEAGVISSMRTAVHTANAIQVAEIVQTADEAAATLPISAGGPAIPVAADPARSNVALQVAQREANPNIGREPPAPAKAVQRGWDYKARNENVMKIEAALQKPTEVNFSDSPLTEALNYLEDLHHIEIMIDRQALQDESIPEDSQITLSISGVTLKSVLRLALQPLGLDYVIRNETLTVLPRAKAAELLETRVYNIRRLNGITAAELDEIIRATIEPESWSSVLQTVGGMPKSAGGPSKLPAVCQMMSGPPGGGFELDVASNQEGNIRYTRNSLVIRQTQQIHDDIVDLLNQLEKTTDDAGPAAAGQLQGF